MDIDHRGTSFSETLLESLLEAVRDLGSGGIFRLGGARFDEATFTGKVNFAKARFSADVSFDKAKFSEDAIFANVDFGTSSRFRGTEFRGDVWFDFANFFGEAHFRDARFRGDAWFREVRFRDYASFAGASFAEEVHFRGAKFDANASFSSVTADDDAVFRGVHFSRSASFHGAKIQGGADFRLVNFSGGARFDRMQISRHGNFAGARFSVAPFFGPIVCGETVNLTNSVFEAAVTLEIAAKRVLFDRTVWKSTATVRLRYATADLSRAVTTSPVAVTAHPISFATGAGNPVDEASLAGCSAEVSVVSMQGVDAAHLVLTDVDLSNCLFSGAFHLDQLRLEGRCTFAPAPVGWHRRGMWVARWTRRRTLAEEHHWRAQDAGQPSPGHTASPRQWRSGPHHPEPSLTPDPEDVAALYRQLRKAFEDGKNEPGAADFYYGECEMRRNDRTGTPTGERRLLLGYWLLSGYGLRASRAFAWLLAAMSLTVLLLMGFGLPTHEPRPATNGTLRGQAISLSTTTQRPVLSGSWPQRMTAARAEKATRVAINSVVFRSSGQNLTNFGTYIEMLSRLLEPTLLALGVLAVRGRIKR
ncbi:pentapeptide repeat-containing protein [Streptomyces sp. NPDC057456]|uniref:pentapeptide repeat-containing protein n=1 Tax=Streptomyces sp. NPDC057456 TaxID=3346139 RepID=UPI0036BD45B4